MLLLMDKSRLKFVPEVSVIRLGQALSVITGCKGYVGSSLTFSKKLGIILRLGFKVRI